MLIEGGINFGLFWTIFLYLKFNGIESPLIWIYAIAGYILGLLGIYKSLLFAFVTIIFLIIVV